MGNAPLGKCAFIGTQTPGRMSGETRLAEAARSPMVEKPQRREITPERRPGPSVGLLASERTGRAYPRIVTARQRDMRGGSTCSTPATAQRI